MKSIEAEVTVYPEISNSVPKGMQLTDDDKRCLNRYYEYNIQFESEDRIRWKCQTNCSKGYKCCMRYDTIDRIMAIEGNVDECKDMSQLYANTGMQYRLKAITDVCEPEFTYRSDKCKELKLQLSNRLVPQTNTSQMFKSTTSSTTTTSLATKRSTLGSQTSTKPRKLFNTTVSPIMRTETKFWFQTHYYFNSIIFDFI